MYAGIQQLPLQIFRKMKRLTRSLIIARLSQLVILLPVVYYFFSEVDFTTNQAPTVAMVVAFALVIFSVVASSLGQNVEMHLRTKDLLPLKIRFDFSFIKNLLKNNRKYGFSYFFSSFHTLLVLMFLGWFFPTSEGFKYAGIWALALSLIEILLLIPSSLGTSLLHKIPKYSIENNNVQNYSSYQNNYYDNDYNDDYDDDSDYDYDYDDSDSDYDDDYDCGCDDDDYDYDDSDYDDYYYY